MISYYLFSTPQGFELFSVILFTIDFLVRLYTAPLSSAFCNSRIYYLTSFFGIVDILSIAPYYVEQVLTVPSTGHVVQNATAEPYHALRVYSSVATKATHEDTGGSFVQIFRVFRIFRLVQLERFVTAFSMLDDVYRGAKGT